MTAQSVVTLLHSHALFLVRMVVHVVTGAGVNCVSSVDDTQLELGSRPGQGRSRRLRIRQFVVLQVRKQEWACCCILCRCSMACWRLRQRICM